MSMRHIVWWVWNDPENTRQIHTLDKQTQNQTNKTQQTKHKHFETTHQNEIRQDGYKTDNKP